jgi:Tfp pilus assembly protein PilO
MKKLLKYVDRRVIAMLVVMAIVFFGLNITWVSSASKNLESNRQAKTAAETELNELRSRLSDIRADGVTSSQALLSRLERLESLLPFAADDISIAQLVIAAAETAGVTLERFQPASDPVVQTDKNKDDTTKDGDKPKDPSVVSGLKAYRYDFKVTGSYLAVANFLNTVVASRAVVVTFDGLYLYSSTKADNPSIFDEFISGEGQLFIWTSLEKHLSSGDAATEGTGNSGAPASTTVPPTPATSTPATSTPANSTPVTSTPAAGGSTSTTPAPSTTTP